jgi:hypothetical protein
LIVGLISVAIALCVVGVGIFMFFSNSEESYPEFLTSHDWESCDPEISCTESINFREDGGFSYHCGCGSPVEDYDLFDSYTYDSENNVIKVKGLGTRKIKVLYYDETMLFLKLPDGAFKYFINEDAISIDEEFDFARDMLEEAQLYVNIREGDGEHITIVPQHYSADELERYEDLEFCAPVAKDAKVYWVYYKVVGDDNFKDLASSEKVTAKILPKLEATYGDTLRTVTLPAGWDWSFDAGDPEETTVGDAGEYEEDVDHNSRPRGQESKNASFLGKQGGGVGIW